MKVYTVGEVVRLGLLKNHKGQPYNDKTAVIRVIKSIAKRRKTPHGKGYAITEAQIKKLNSRW